MPDKLKAKIEAGTEFVQTQFCMDLDVLKRYLRRLADDGLLERVFFLIGIAPLASAQSAHWMRKNLPGVIISDAIVTRMERATDQKAEGRRICVELLQQLQQIKGVAGAHVMAPLNEASLAPTLAAFRRR